MPVSVPESAAQLSTHGYLRDKLDAKLATGSEWKQFTDSWNNLRQDNYMADGGTYRLRRYSEFHCHARTSQVRLLPHVPYAQSKEVNHLNGGIERSFEPFEGHIADSPVLHTIFQRCAEVMAAADGGHQWKVQTFQNRILARSAEQGQPAPEGMHRDGVDFVLTLLIERNSVVGGTSSVYDADSRTCRAEVQLTEPGEYLFVDDERMLHDVTALSPAAGSEEGRRDVLIAMFTRTDNAAVGQ